MTEHRSASSRLMPFRRVARRLEQERMQTAIAAVCARHPELAEKEPAWFGHKLQADNSRRYHALGYLADPDAGLEDGRGFVVDVVAGHVMRELPLERRRDLPLDISALA